MVDGQGDSLAGEPFDLFVLQFKTDIVHRRRDFLLGDPPMVSLVVNVTPDGANETGPGGLPQGRSVEQIRSGDQADSTDWRPWVKRPAWLFSARARVSSHSATCSKPSSRAVLAKPGYISVY